MLSIYSIIPGTYQELAQYTYAAVEVGIDGRSLQFIPANKTNSMIEAAKDAPHIGHCAPSA